MKRPRNIRAALIGEKLGISAFPQIHGQLADYPYALISLAPKDLPLFLKSDSFNAFNVTTPYRHTILPYLDHISAEASRIGAVNTVIRNLDGTFSGFNTDYDGFCYTLDSLDVSLFGKKVMILGSGVASKTVAAVAADRGARKIVVISRRGRSSYNSLDRHADAQILINTTPVGMYPDNGKVPVDIARLPELEAVIDLIYDPARTKLLLDAQARGVKHCNGLPMLIAQAKRSAEIFTDTKIPDSEITRIIKAVGERWRNILFIGLPRCGKSTLARMIATRSARNLVDIDAEIEKQAGCSIEALLATQGEAALREAETELLAKYTKESELVIAVSADAARRPENIALMQQNARVVFLDIPFEILHPARMSTANDENEKALYSQRRTLCLAAAEFAVPVTRDFDENVIKIKEALK